MKQDFKATKQAALDFWGEGLLWLVNTAILHPRGYALSIDLETGELGMCKLKERIYFEPGFDEDVIKKYEQAEKKRKLK